MAGGRWASRRGRHVGVSVGPPGRAGRAAAAAPRRGHPQVAGPGGAGAGPGPGPGEAAEEPGAARGGGGGVPACLALGPAEERCRGGGARRGSCDCRDKVWSGGRAGGRVGEARQGFAPLCRPCVS